jgi:two-component system CheB/CheR fusion protein
MKEFVRMEEARGNSFLPSSDIETTDILEQDILPRIISQARLSNQVIRLWLIEWGTPELPILLCLWLVHLLGQAFAHFNLKIFVTVRDEKRLHQMRHSYCSREELARIPDEELACFCESTDEGYRLSADLRKLLIFGRHDPLHDPFFAHMDLIICGLSLHALPQASQQQFFAGISACLQDAGLFVCQRADTDLLARFPFVPFREGLPLYQLAKSSQTSEPHLLAEDESKPEPEETSAKHLRHLLQTSRHMGKQLSERSTSLSAEQSKEPVPLLNILLRLAPIGIVVLSHNYQMLTLNRAARKLLTPVLYEESCCDFFHAIGGLPYQEVRTAIDTVMQEGISQTLPEVELTVSAGGNGRVLSFEIYPMPTEVGYPPQVILYVWDVTMQTVAEKTRLQQAHAIQEMRTANAHLKTQYEELVCAHEHLLETSQQLLLDYQRLLHQLETTQENCRQLDQQVEQLLEEITVLTEQSDQ